MNNNGIQATGVGRFLLLGVMASVLISSIATTARADDADRFHRFFDHMVETYYKPVGIEADDVTDLFQVTNGRFVAITMGYGLSRQAKLVKQDNARHTIFNGLITRVETLLDNFAEAEMNNAAGGRADKAAIEKYKGELRDLFAASLTGFVDKQVEAFGVPPKIPSIFEEDAWKLAYPQSMPPVSFMFARWGEMSAYDGKPVGMYRSKMLTSKTGQHGYLFENVKEDLYGEKAIKYWRIEGNRMLWLRANGTVFADMEFRVNKDRWEFYGKMLDEKGEHMLNRSDKRYMDMVVWLDIPDRFAVQVPAGGSAGQTTPTTATTTPTPTPVRANAGTNPTGGGKPAAGTGGGGNNATAPNPLRGDPVAVKVALKEINKWGMSGNVYKLKDFATGNALRQLDYIREWEGKNRLEAKFYRGLLVMASLSFGEPQLNASGDKATVSASLVVFGHEIPYRIDGMELQLVDGAWKLANVRYTKLKTEEEKK